MKIIRNASFLLVLVITTMLFITSCDTSSSSGINSNITNNEIQDTNSGIDNTTNVPESSTPIHTHNYSSATCSEAAKCSCGVTSGNALGHAYSNATCSSSRTCSRCGMTNGDALGHSWSAATCSSPQTCSRCGTTNGYELGHFWKNATCSSPKTCSRCGTTSGYASGHSWKNATCSSPQTCSRCGTTSGNSLGHSWNNATCSSPQTCSRCRATNGNALGHSYSSGVCSRCGDRDSSYVQTYSVGEKWVVDGQWEFTVNSVTIHRLCNSVHNREDGYTNEQVILIDYTYKNIGYTGKYIDLYISAVDFNVYDETGEAADIYACTHNNNAKECVVGTRCTAQEAYVLVNNSSEIKLVVELYTSNGTGKAKATFNLKIS